MLSALFVLLFATSPVAGIPAPLDGVYETELTRVATEQASREMKEALALLEKDPTRTPAEKAEVKRRISQLKIAIYTTAKSIDAVVTEYERVLTASEFTFGERGLLEDLVELSRTGAFAIDAETDKEWRGKRGRSARWHKLDGTIGIDIEDHLLDPRTGKITKKTVVMISAAGP